MRIGQVTISPIAFYSQPLWDISYAYRIILLTWRLIELGLISARFLFIRAPILLLWTRLPITKSITLPHPYGNLQRILSPEREAKLNVAGGRSGHMPFLDAYKSPEDIKKQQEFLRRIVKPPSPTKVAIGGIVRGLVTELGTVFIKFSQILSMRPELPPFLREELALVQDKVASLPKREIDASLERELMQPVEEVFEWINYEAVASASLAVVHEAKLRNGDSVALKIQRPFLQGTVALDTVIILNVILGAAKVILPRIRKTDLTFFTLSFQSSLQREINFSLEACIQQIGREAMMAAETTADYMCIAKVYPEYTTTKLLTMEFIHGIIRVDDLFDKLEPEEIWDLLTTEVPGFSDLPVHILILGCRFPMQLAWQGEFFHGDLHLGNIMFIKPQNPGDHWRYFLCDFGMYEDIPREGYRFVMLLLWGLLGGYADMTTEALKSLHVEAGGKIQDIDWDRIYVKFHNFGRMWSESEDGIQGLRRSKQSEGGLTRQLLNLLFSEIIGSGLRLPYWLWLVLKSYLYLEEAGTSIMGGSYNWMAWIFDQYAVRIEKDATIALFDRTNVFTMNKSLDLLPKALPRSKDHKCVTKGLLTLCDNIEEERIQVASQPVMEEARA
ncbi:MAG: AarF/UbiB family protein [Chloroflexota bacterium]|nr:AarF/UbiB family protein [Chloroflexota bacterium]